jgi:hypothetical protein
MKKIVLLFGLLTIAILSNSQTKISQLPTYTGSLSGNYVPIVVGGVTKKIDAGSFVTIDSTKIPYLAKNNNFTGLDTFPSIVWANNGSDTFATQSYVRSHSLSLPYKIVSGYLSSSDTINYSFNTFQNDFTGITFAASKNNVGEIYITSSSDAFSSASYKNFFIGSTYCGSGYIPYIVTPRYSTTTVFKIRFYNTLGQSITPVINNYNFEIRVYP